MNSVPTFDVGAVLRARQAAMDLYSQLYARENENGTVWKYSEEAKQACADTVQMADMLLRMEGLTKDAVSLREGIVYSVIKSRHANKETAEAAE